MNRLSQPWRLCIFLLVLLGWCVAMSCLGDIFAKLGVAVSSVLVLIGTLVVVATLLWTVEGTKESA